jgi:hypothetical protein
VQQKAVVNFSKFGQYLGLLILSTVLLLVSQSSFAAIAFRAASSNGIATATGGLAINVPAGTVTGDVMIASIAWRQNNPAIIAPSGWTLVRETNQTNGGGASNRFATYIRVVTGLESASYSWSFSGGTFSGAVGAITTFSGVDSANPIDAEGGNTTPYSFSHSANSITTSVADTVIVSSHEFPSATSDWTSPAGMTEIVDATSIPRPDTVGIALSMNYVSQAGIGVTGNKTAVAASGGTDAGDGAAHILALRPGTTTPPPTTTIAYYAMDEASWNGSANEVVDGSGNGNHGQAVGAANTVSPGRVCRGGDIPFNNDDSNQYAIDTGLDVNNAIGNSGTIAFWYKSNANWNGGGDRALYDASLGSKYFFLVLLNNGSLRFGLEDSADGDFRFDTSQYSYTTTDWVHIAVTWDLPGDRLEIYVNGGLAASNTGNTTGVLGNMDTLYFGDNRTNYHPGGTGNSSNGIIDEVYIFNTNVDSATIQVTRDATHSCPSTGVCETFRDEFSSRNYGLNNGTVNWATNWIESGDGGGPNSGDITIENTSTDGELHLQDRNNSISRAADLSSYDTATLSFDYRKVSLEAGDWVAIEIRTGGGSWQRLNTFPGPVNDSGTYSINIDAYMASDTEIRFLTSPSMSNWDDFYVDDAEIEACTSGTSLDHYLINHDGFGINCVTENLTITAMDGNTPSAPIDPAGATITLDTQSSRGDWSLITGSGAFNNGAANDGIATYTFAAGETSAEFGLEHREGSSPITLAVSDGTASDDGSHGPLPFSPNGFTVTSSAIGNPPVIPVPPFDPQIAGTDFPIYITAYGVTPADPVCGVIEAYDGQKALQFWSSYDNPGSGTLQVSITDDNNTQSIATAEGSATARAVTFTQGQAQVTGKYKDVGQITISMKDTTVAGPNLPNGIRGNAQFVVKPDHFDIHTIQCSDGTSNPAAADQNGARFCTAGEPFSVTIDAKDSEADTTPNYGQESVAEDVQLTSNLIAPAGGNNSAIAVLTPDPFSAGSSSPQISWSEVGIITLTPSVADGNYLGAGDVTGTTTGNIGRFYPFDFNVTLDNSPNLAPASSTFSYIGQDLLYNVAPQVTITARPSNGSGAALIGGVTLNYDGLWWKLADFTETVTQDVSSPLPAGVTLDSTVAGHSAIDCSAGTCDGTFTTTFNGQFLYTRSVAETVPFDGIIDIAFPIDDGDAQYAANPFVIQNLAFSGGSNQQRSGRMAVFDVYGSELYGLMLPVAVQYWNDVGTGDYAFITASDDTTSTLAVGDVTLGNYSGNLSSGETAVTAATLANGTGSITLSAPGDGNEGGVDVTADLTAAGSNQPWLQFDWDGDSALDDNPTGHALFGIYTGSEKQIYIRERY